MHRPRLARLVSAFAFVLVLALGGSLAFGFPNLQKAFIKEYVASNPDNKEWAAEVKKAGCWVCHQGKNRKHRNAYGAHLAELVDMKKDGKDEAKLIAALQSVAAMHSVEGDDKSPTYGDLIKEGKLPGGSLEDAKQEPADDAK